MLRLTPVIKRVMKVLGKQGFYIVRMRGDHIIINREPALKRPIILVNEKRLSNAVRLNLIKECKEAGIKREGFDGIF